MSKRGVGKLVDGRFNIPHAINLKNNYTSKQNKPGNIRAYGFAYDQFIGKISTGIYTVDKNFI
jgi:hypothetical protein